MTNEKINSNTEKEAAEPLAYAPILRNGPSERSVIREFGGLNRFIGPNRGELYTVIEVTERDDLNNLTVFQNAADLVLIDLPSYLTQDENSLSEDVQGVIDESGSVADFFAENKDRISVPVLSGTLSSPITYRQYLQLYHEVSPHFGSIALRLFLRPIEFSEEQKANLKKIQAEISEDDLVLFDLIEVGRLKKGEQGYENFSYLCELFGENERIIMNAFSSYDGENRNFGPSIAKETGAEGFGDFAINVRYPNPVPLGNIDTRIIRQYSPTESQVFEFKGDGYGGAFKELEDWDLWNPDHCEFCRRADNENTEWLSFWKRIRMGHYISSALEEEAV
ncbi:hypothetical protein HYG81_21470 (plasmid) [Natrinema zhouii]|uniref:hypothetical protein n=1 Tax=Natrinema zhouii TaxID=1710539 RepID=UPI001CFFE6B4|nr:hypothetical protein [Natrinema zhouii]UHQ98147.1 hypothetical protein HYG81_21470 [Natrinema zhouii]